MNRTRFANIDELKCKLLREWAKLDHEIIASAIRHWRRRLRACETADGGHIEQAARSVDVKKHDAIGYGRQR